MTSSHPRVSWRPATTISGGRRGASSSGTGSTAIPQNRTNCARRRQGRTLTERRLRSGVTCGVPAMRRLDREAERRRETRPVCCGAWAERKVFRPRRRVGRRCCADARRGRRWPTPRCPVRGGRRLRSAAPGGCGRRGRRGCLRRPRRASLVRSPPPRRSRVLGRGGWRRPTRGRAGPGAGPGRALDLFSQETRRSSCSDSERPWCSETERVWCSETERAVCSHRNGSGDRLRLPLGSWTPTWRRRSPRPRFPSRPWPLP